MSARNFNNGRPLLPLSTTPTGHRLLLPTKGVRIVRNGLEFQNATPINTWTEMTIELECPRENRAVRVMGVVVACKGNRHEGYVISMLFTSVSRQSQNYLDSLMFADRGLTAVASSGRG